MNQFDLNMAPLYIVLYLVSFHLKSTYSGSVKIKMVNSSTKPIQEDVPGRRSSVRTPEYVCANVAAATGQLIARRLLETGYIRKEKAGKPIDVDNLVGLLANSAVKQLGPQANCPDSLVGQTASSASRSLLCGQPHCDFNDFTNYSIEPDDWENIEDNFEQEADIIVQPIITNIINIYQESLTVTPFVVKTPSNYVQPAILGTIVGCHIVKTITQIGTLSLGPGFHVNILNAVVKSVINQLSNTTSFSFEYQTENICLKTLFYWLINNFATAKVSTISLVIKTTLVNYGLGQYFPTKMKLLTNNAPIDLTNVKLYFPAYTGSVEFLTQYIVKNIKFHEIAKDCNNILQKTDKINVDVPDSLKKLQLEPPKAHEQNVVLTATLATIVGINVAQILPKFTLVSSSHYTDLQEISLLDVLKKVAVILSEKLSLNFNYTPIAAAKVTIMSINNPSASLELLFKKFKILQFYPQFDTVKTELTLLTPPRDISLWIKPIFNVNLEKELNRNIKLCTEEILQEIEKTLREIFQQEVKNIPPYADEKFTWEPPEVLAFVYQEAKSQEKTFQASPRRTNIICPGHYMCNDSPTPYVCVTGDPWCYLPNELICPGNINCPVIYKNMTCPGDPKCPNYIPECPGSFSCPEEPVSCPGHPSCPVLLKCPGDMCPKRFINRPQVLVPCPEHDFCRTHMTDVLKCYMDTNCAYVGQQELVGAIRDVGQTIAKAITQKNMTVTVNSSSMSNIYMTNTSITSKSTANSNSLSWDNETNRTANANAVGKLAAAAAASTK